MRSGIALDCETELIRPGLLAPPLVCVGVADAMDSYELFHHTEARAPIVALLESEALLVGDNVAFDFCVFAAKWPDLLPLIFEVYEADRVSDTEIREKLNHIAMGVYRGFDRNDGDWEKLNYSLADLARRHLGIELEKGGWQLRFGELMDVPVDWWPEEARDYAIGDAVATLGVWQKQEQDTRYLDDEFRQTRAAFWLQLMSCWGMIADPEGVREFARRTQQKYDAIAEDLVAAGLMREDGTRNVKAVQERVVKAYVNKAMGARPLRKSGQMRLVVEDKKVKTLIFIDNERSKTFIEMTSGGKTGKCKPKTDADVCERSGDEVLEKYADLSSLKKTLSTDVPLLMKAVHTPLKVRYESLVATGRTSSTPNVQNLPTEVGVRECFRPRPGYVYAVADYAGFELRTWAQVCLRVLGQSKLAEALNAGLDPHLEIARRILGISYEEAAVDYKRDPKGRVYYPRQTGKVCNFGKPGGLGVKRLIDYARKNYNVALFETPEEARANGAPVSAVELSDYWREAWPESRPYFDWINSHTKMPVPIIKQLFVGRYRGDVTFTDAANTMFQGLAADAAKAAGFLIARACYVEPDSPLFGCRPVNFVHDEFLVEVPDDERAHFAAAELARLMCVGAAPFLPDVPPVAEPLLCRKWSKAAKPVWVDGRLVPWDFEEKAEAAE
jgi:DNA polymerase-1